MILFRIRLLRALKEISRMIKRLCGCWSAAGAMHLLLMVSNGNYDTSLCIVAIVVRIPNININEGDGFGWLYAFWVDKTMRTN